MNKQYYVVQDATDMGDGVTVASGVVPATSPALHTSGAETKGSWVLCKVPTDGSLPSGLSVQELSVDEARQCVESELFHSGTTTVGFIQLEQTTCQALRAEFMVAQAGLPLAAADALFTALEPTSHALSAGSMNLAYGRFNASSVDEGTKSAFNPLFESFFGKFPRDMT
jgi:hypothetical protein